MSRRILSAAGGLAVILALAGCTSPSSAPEGEVDISEFAAPASLVDSSYYHQDLHWSSCGDPYDAGDQCTRVRAPLDWTGQASGSIEIALLRHRATGTRLGAIVVDPGGPGESGIELVGESLDNTVTPSVAEHYDVIGVDPRGVGASTAVDCGGATALDRLLYSPLPGTPGSKQWVAADLSRSRSYARACRIITGTLLSHVDTVPAAHDLDVVRAALGEKKLNYLGYSYGSYLGTIYAGLYPSRVGRFVLDGADDPWYEDGEIGKDGQPTGPDTGGDGSDAPVGVVDQAAGFDLALRDYLRACLAADPQATKGTSCPFTGTVAQAQSTIERELAAASATPLKAADGRRMDGQLLSVGMSEALYGSDEWPDLTHLFAQIATGDPTEAFSLADEYYGRFDDGTYDSNSYEAGLAIGCLESGSDYDLAYDKSELARLKKKAPVFGPYFSYSDLSCAGWGGPSAWPTPIAAPDSGPVIVVSTTGDPATPYEEGVALAHQLDHGHLVTYHGEGHTAYDTGVTCVDVAVDDFLLKGIVPYTDPDCH